MFQRFRSLFRVLTRRRDFEDGMSEELRFHIEQYTEDLVRSGISPRKSGPPSHGSNSAAFINIKGDCREAFGVHLFDELRRQLQLRRPVAAKDPGIYSYRASDPRRLLRRESDDFCRDRFGAAPPAAISRARPADDDLQHLSESRRRSRRLLADQLLRAPRPNSRFQPRSRSTAMERRLSVSPARRNACQTMRVSPDFFSTLGLGPAIGRTFTDEETTYRNRPRCHSFRHVLAATIQRRSPRDREADSCKQRSQNCDRRLASRASAFSLPMPGCSSRLHRALKIACHRERHSGGNVIQMIARLQPGATLAQAQSEIDAQNAALEVDDPQAKMIADAGFRSLVVPLHADHVAAVRPTLLLLEAGVLVLLLIGAVNLVNLLLIRASGRVKELAVRQALGASWRYLVSEAVVETTLLTFAGGLLGLAVGAGGIRLLRALGADRLPLGGHIAFDARLALVGLVAAIIMGIVFAAPVAWFNLRRHLGNALQSESRGGTSGRGAQILRHSFIVSQIALAFILLAGAGLLGLSLQRVMAVSPGFRSDHVLTGQILLPWADYPAGSPPGICGKLDGQTRPPTGSVVRGRGQQCAFQWQHRQKRRHGNGSRSPPWRIRARALFLWRRGRLLSRDGFLPAGGTISHRRRFTSL